MVEKWWAINSGNQTTLQSRNRHHLVPLYRKRNWALLVVVAVMIGESSMAGENYSSLMVVVEKQKMMIEIAGNKNENDRCRIFFFFFFRTGTKEPPMGERDLDETAIE
jgi:hypothetical protein